jgi:sigma-B regulation protein RsbU (phosphoserine phosphatase)
VREIISKKNAVVIGDPEQDPRFAQQQSIILSDLKSAVAVPLFDDEKVLGILYADTTSPLHRYGDDHLRVLATFGNIIAAKMLSYQLLAERQERQIMRAELRRASAIQKRLLVTAPPEIEGYRVCAFQEQSRSVGGDLYDMRLLKDGCLLFMVADVSGKGMGAALLMSNILASFRVLFEDSEADLGSAVRTVSQQVFRFSDPGDFATLFIGLLDPRRCTVRYINAGHNPPLVLRADGSSEYLKASGVMIGAFDDMTWEEGLLTLAAGDLLLVFTDGVTEAEGEDEQYGEERLEQLVRTSHEAQPQDVVERLMTDIGDFVGNRPQSDDITMMCIKRTEP